MAGLFNLFSQSPYTLQELVNVDKGRQERSQLLNVSLDKIYHRVKVETLWDRIKNLFKRNNSTINMYYTILKFKVDSPSGNTYTVLVEFQPNFNIGYLMRNKVRVYCSCPSFMYQSAYLLNRRGNLYRSSKTDILLGESLTVAPDARKTKTSPCCKHVFACIGWINTNLDYILNNI